MQLAFIALTLLNSLASTQDTPQNYQFETGILYRSPESKLTDYMRERCQLDVYYPVDTKDFATVVWFHGGGLRSGRRHVPEGLRGQGVAVVAVSYRLHPKVQAPAYIEDAAAAVAWVLKNIRKYGGSSKKVFVSGHSAGGYLTSMIGMDKRWLAMFNANANDLAGLIPLSGHTITHFTVREERGIKGTRAIVDELAPVYHVRKDSPRMLLITGDRELEMLGRYEENAYFWRMMQVVKHPNTKILELEGCNHTQMVRLAQPHLLKFMRSDAQSPKR